MAPASGTYAAIPFVGRAEDPRALISVGSACIILCTVSVGLRMYTKWKYVGKIRIDDWLMCFSLALLGVYCAVVIVGGSVVAKPNNVPLQASELALSINLLNQGEVFYIATIAFLKISIGIFFLQIVQAPRLRQMIYIAVGISTVFSVAMFFFAVFQCGVYDGIWDFILKRFTNRCVSDAAALGMTYTHALITVFVDWMFLILPFFILRNTLMAKREKFAIGFVLAFGSISGIAAIARLPYIRILAVEKSQIFDQIQNIAIWSAVEPAVGITAGSLVTIRPLFRVMFPGASRGNAYSPMEIPTLATIATTQVDENEEKPHDKLEAFYNDSSFGSSRPMTPISSAKEKELGDVEKGRRPSDTATLVDSPSKKRGVFNTDFKFPATKSTKKANKETFLFDQTIDEPEKATTPPAAKSAITKATSAAKQISAMWSPPNWDTQQEAPRRVAKPLLPTPTTTISSVEIDEPLVAAAPTLKSRFQPIKPNPQDWELRDWDRRAEPIGGPSTQDWQKDDQLNLPPPRKPKQSMLARHLSARTVKVFPARGKSVIEPGLPLDMFFGDDVDDMSDTASNISRQPSRRYG